MGEILPSPAEAGSERRQYVDRLRAVSRVALPLLACVALLVVTVLAASAHEGHGDPELLNHWRTQVHLLFQWAHLVAFALWVGGILSALRLPALGLERLLFGTWILFLVSLGTGGYNMEYSAATAEPPDVLALPAMAGRYEFGDAYILLVGVKQGLFALAAMLTLAVTVVHLRWPGEKPHVSLRRLFVIGSATLGVLLAMVTAMVLVLHEAVDLAPTPLHSLGGVVGPRGPHELALARAARVEAPLPYGAGTRRASAGFELFTIPAAVADALSRFGHLVGFALWLGGMGALLLGLPGDARRVMPLLWLGLALLGVTGVYQLVAWTPFAVAPLPWRLEAMGHFRFGYTYTALLTPKLALAAVAGLGTLGLGLLVRGDPPHGRGARWVRVVAVINFVVGLVLAYTAVALLLVHEGVDHAL